MIDRGATTMWERWEGVDAEGVPHESLNHYSKGAVVSFLHRYVAGLRRLEPTWTRFRVQPRPGGGLTARQLRDAKMILWRGHCSVHGRFTVESVEDVRTRIPDVTVLVHPESNTESNTVIATASPTADTRATLPTGIAAPRFIGPL